MSRWSTSPWPIRVNVPPTCGAPAASATPTGAVPTAARVRAIAAPANPTPDRNPLKRTTCFPFRSYVMKTSVPDHLGAGQTPRTRWVHYHQVERTEHRARSARSVASLLGRSRLRASSSQQRRFYQDARSLDPYIQRIRTGEIRLGQEEPGSGATCPQVDQDRF